MGSKNQPAGATTTTTNQAPWGPQQPYLQDIFQNAQGLYQTGGPQYYPSSTYAPLNGAQTASLGQIENFGLANSSLIPGVTAANAALAGGSTNATNPGITSGILQNFAGGNYLNGGAQNPYTQALSQNVLSSVVPSIESQFVQGGGLSSPQAAYATSAGATNALAPSLFSNYQTQEQLAQNAAGTLGNLYNTGAQNQLGAVAMAPQTAGLPYLGPEQALQAGTAEQQNSQNAINAAIQNWNYNQTLPWQNLNEMIGQISGNYGGATSATQPFYENTGANLGAGALGGGLLGSSLFAAPNATTGAAGGLLSSTGISPGIGKLLGTVLGGGAAAVSDRRIKEDIQKLADLPGGLGVYSFRYIGDDEHHIGLMADEVERVFPEAVITRPSGIKMVDYSAFI